MNLMGALSAFHFLRPYWFLLLVPIAALWWWYRFRFQQGEARSPHFAPHLARALRIGDDARRRFSPVDSLTAMALCLVIGLAGPSWSRVANPMISQTAPLVIALEVTPSMMASDVPPTRLERAAIKIENLLATRSGAQTALIAYAGSAHLVVPPTSDPALIKPYLEGLTPQIMPVDGDVSAQALALADSVLADQTVAGTILFVSDGMSASNRTAFEARESAHTLAFLTLLPEGQPAPVVDELDARQVRVSADDSDVESLERTLASAYRQALLNDDRLAWKDRSAWLAWPAAFFALLGFRRGWSLGAVALVTGVLPLSLIAPGSALAQQNDARVSKRAVVTEAASPLVARLMDAFLTPDQQGRWWLEHRQYRRASEQFEDPAWRGYALYRDGQYGEAVAILNPLETAGASFTQGLALIRNRQYREAITAFETTLARDPDYPEGERNLALARQILTYVEETREQSDTGEDRGEGADDVVFDNEAQRGVETTVTGDEDDQLLTPDQWISSIDSDTGDYLRQRFALEAAEATP
ncbi:MAG: VWA domain-containing protein [Salinicola sp.]|uniref:VWA domain-containing protein n=1 Tax=Salinicola sp. TaxID=1978524 RepID=UPI001E0A6CE3|nr:VWA domain-containing protein [Salinicola sp.]NRB56172.1 VWA domain-containing protein [Salinicola sp.]